MHDDAINALAELRDELDVAAQRMATMPRPEAATGTDPTGAVTVIVNPIGRVAQVAVTQRWRMLIGIDEVATAVRQAALAARRAQITTWAPAAEQASAVDPRPRPIPLPHESLGARLADLTAPDSGDERTRATLEELLAVVESAERSLDEAVKRIETQEISRHIGFDRTRHVMVSVNGGGEIADIRCDLRWLNAAQASIIGQEITAAFEAAYQDVDTTGDSAARRALAEFQALAKDPRALARRLYLCDD